MACKVYLFDLGEKDEHKQHHAKARYDERVDIILGQELKGYLVFALFERDSYKAVKHFFLLDLFIVDLDRPALLVRNGGEKILSFGLGGRGGLDIGIFKLCDVHHVLLQLCTILRKGIVIKRAEDVISPESLVILVVDSYSYPYSLSLVKIAKLEDRIVISHKELTCHIHRRFHRFISVFLLHPDVAVALVGRWEIHIKRTVAVHFHKIVDVGIGNCGIIYIILDVAVNESFLEHIVELCFLAVEPCEVVLVLACKCAEHGILIRERVVIGKDYIKDLRARYYAKSERVGVAVELVGRIVLCGFGSELILLGDLYSRINIGGIACFLHKVSDIEKSICNIGRAVILGVVTAVSIAQSLQHFQRRGIHC